MFSNWLLVSVSIGYIGLLFLIAYLGGKYRNKLKEKHSKIIKEVRGSLSNPVTEKLIL